MGRYIIAWFPMLVIAIANGALRQLTFAKVMPELPAGSFWAEVRCHAGSQLDGPDVEI